MYLFICMFIRVLIISVLFLNKQQTSVRQVVLDQWFPLSAPAVWDSGLQLIDAN